MGFLNRCLSLALVLWASGPWWLWLRFTGWKPGARLVSQGHWVRKGYDPQRTHLTADLVILDLSALALL